MHAGDVTHEHQWCGRVLSGHRGVIGSYVRDPSIRHTLLSYVFGVAILATTLNLVVGVIT